MKTLFALILFVGISTYTSAQNKLEAGLVAIPSHTNFHISSDFSYYEPIFAFNYGAKVKLRQNKFIFSTGILQLTQGTKLKIANTSTDNPEGNGELYDLYLRARAIAVPINVDYIFASTKTTEFFGSLGIYLGYVYFEQSEDTSIPEDYEPDTVLDETPARQRYYGLDAFDDFYAAANIGIGVRQALGEHLSAEFRPNFLYQLRQELPKETNDGTLRLMSFNAEIGLYYSF